MNTQGKTAGATVKDRLRAFFTTKEPEPGKRDRSYLVWTFLIPFSFMLLLYVLDEVFPFGENSVLILDLNAQYIGFYEALRAFVYGDGSMLYSFSRALGGEMMGVYAYYIASPLSYLVALFPKEYITEAIFFIFVLKAGLCGLTFGIYLDRHRYAKPTETVIFSTLYALCSFAIVMQNNSMWIDNLILLPLLTLGIERVVKYRRFGLYTAALALALLSNFYIGYMTCLYTLLYFLYYSYGYRWNKENNPLGERQHYLRSLARMGVFSAVAVGIAAIILLTVAYSLSLGKSTFTDPSYIPHIQFDPIAFFSKLLPGVYDTVEPEGLPFVYCGTLTVLLVPLYFLNRRFAKGERIATGVLLAVFYVSMSVSSLDMLWHGGQAPNWLNYRYSFFVCFLLLVLASRALCRLEDISVRRILSVTVILLALIAVAYSMGYDHLPLWAAAVAAVFLAVLTALLIAMRRWGKQTRAFFTALLALVVLSEAFYNGSIQLSGLHENVGLIYRYEYRDYIDRMQRLTDYIEERDDGFYRTETTSHRGSSLNDAFALSYRGLTNSTSTLQADTIRFMHRMGLLSQDHWSRYEGSTVVLDSLLGIKYIATTATSYPQDGYIRLPDAPAYVYENPYALPIAYAVSAAIKDVDLGVIKEPLARQNAVVGAMLGGDAATIYTPIKPDSETLEKIEIDYIEDYDGTMYKELASYYYLSNIDVIESGALPEEEWDVPTDTGVTWEVTVARDGDLYFYIPTDYPNTLTVIVNGTDNGTLFGDETDYLQNLGHFAAGERVTVSIRFAKDTLFFYHITDTAFFYQEDTEAAYGYLDRLAENGMTVTAHNDTSLSGVITTTEERPTVLTTIPYDTGWIVTVDGEEVKTHKTLDALLSFDAPAGEHTVELVYRPASYVLGRGISLISLGIFILLLTLDYMLRHRIIRPWEGSFADRALSVFFYYGQNKLPEEPDYLSDAYMPLPVPKPPKTDGAEPAAEAPQEASEEDEGDTAKEDTDGE